MRKFEKISYEQFCKDVKIDKKLYEDYKLPTRNSTNAAGYDIYLLEDLEIRPHEIAKIPTGIKACFNSDEVLLLIVRSSTGFKYNIRLVNQVGVIDADYYNNPSNEGHIFIKIQNESENVLNFESGYSLVQGMFMKFLVTDDDQNLNNKRTSKY